MRSGRLHAAPAESAGGWSTGRILGTAERRYGVLRAVDRWDGYIQPDEDLDLL